MTQELFCKSVIKYNEGPVTLTIATQHAAKHCASSHTAVCQRHFVLLQPLGTQADAIYLAELGYFLAKFL